MSMREELLKIAGKDNLIIDKRISTGYLIRLCWKYGWMMVRGRAVSLTGKGISSDVFIGKHVKLIERKYLTIGSKTKTHDNVKIDALSTDGVSIGSHCVIGRGTSIECTGNLTSLGVGLKIGNRTTFGNDCFFGAAGGITIGDDVVAGQYVRFHSENHKYKDMNCLIRKQGVSHKGIIIGNNCWIGSGAVFLDGARVGDGCVIAANAVITKEFPDNSIIGGVPAKLIRIRN